MDQKLRELERRATSDPSAREQFIKEMHRLGYQEVSEAVGQSFRIDDYETISFDSLNERAANIKSNKGYYRFGLQLEVECDHDDMYGATSHINAILVGYRLETDEELKRRMRVEKEHKERQKLFEKQQRERYKEQKQRQEKIDRETYARLKKKFEKEENFNKYMELVGAEAATKLREYSDSYLKGWFWRKQPKLNGKTAEDFLKDGDVDTVRKLALKQL